MIPEEAIKAIENILRNKDIAEVKIEQDCIVVVDISRKLKFKCNQSGIGSES